MNTPILKTRYAARVFRLLFAVGLVTATVAALATPASAATAVAQGRLLVTQATAGVAVVNQPITYSITVTNTTSTIVSAVTLGDTPPTGMSIGIPLGPGGNPDLCARTKGSSFACTTADGNLAPGAVLDVTFTGTASSAGAFTNTAVAQGCTGLSAPPPAGQTCSTAGGLFVTNSLPMTVSVLASAPTGTVPGAPTAVTATAGDGLANISWTPPASNGGDPITTYTVMSSPPGGAIIVAAPATTALITGLVNGKTYTFSVTASSDLGTGPASAPSNSVTPSAGATAPGAPTAVTATAGNAQASVTWTAPVSNGGSAITSYTASVATVNGVAPVTPITASVAAPATTATVTGLTNGSAYTFTVVAVNAIGTSPASIPSNSITPQPSPIVLLPQPQRVVDTRAGTGMLGAGQPLQGLTTPNCYTLAGAAGIPATAVGVLLNVTVTQFPVAGFATVYPAGAAVPATSNVNFAVGEPAIANNATVKLGTGGQVCAIGQAGTQLILDAVGYLADGSPTSQVQLLPQPTRLVDTRPGTGFLGAGQPLVDYSTPVCYTLAGLGGIPTTAAGVLLNVTTTQFPAAGFATVYPAGGAVPATSNVNFTPAQQAVANGATVALGTGGQVCAIGQPGTDLILDAVGYLANTSASTQVQLLAQPTRLVDTRAGTGLLGAGQALFGYTTPNCYTLTGLAGIPSTAVGLLLNVTTTAYPVDGFATVYPGGSAAPATSNLNFTPTEPAIANGALVKIGTGGQVCAIGQQFTQLILDAVGYLAH